LFLPQALTFTASFFPFQGATVWVPLRAGVKFIQAILFFERSWSGRCFIPLVPITHVSPPRLLGFNSLLWSFPLFLWPPQKGFFAVPSARGPFAVLISSKLTEARGLSIVCCLCRAGPSVKPMWVTPMLFFLRDTGLLIDVHSSSLSPHFSCTPPTTPKGTPPPALTKRVHSPLPPNPWQLGALN